MREGLEDEAVRQPDEAGPAVSTGVEFSRDSLAGPDPRLMLLHPPDDVFVADVFAADDSSAEDSSADERPALLFHESAFDPAAAS